MSFDLSSISKTKTDRPPRVLVYGPHKIGKSTWASQAPAPIFIPTEDGLDAIDAEAFPLCRTWADVMEAIATLYTDKHEYQTVVLDSADWAEKLVQAKIADDHGAKSIASEKGNKELGYGKGYVMAAEEFKTTLDGFNALRNDRGMGVILLCHTEIRKFDDPLAESYDRYQIKLHKGVAKLIQEWADVIGFAQERMVTKIEKEKGFAEDRERARAVAVGSRVLNLGISPAFDGGNRYGLPTEIPFTWEAFGAAMAEARK